MAKTNFLKSNWVVTLTATLIGVFLALYMNELLSTNKTKNQTNIATDNILFEIQENKKSLEENIGKHSSMIEIFDFMEKYIDEDKRLITEVDNMQVIRAKYSDIFIVKDSTLLEDGKYHYTGNFNMNFNLSFINLSSLAWNTFRNSNLTTDYDFNCLMFLERLDKITIETIKQERLLFEIMQNPDDYEKDTYNAKLNHTLKVLVDAEKGLLNAYEHSETELSDCQ